MLKRNIMKGVCRFCGKPADYKNVNHCRKCHSKYNRANNKAVRERMKQWRKKIKHLPIP